MSRKLSEIERVLEAMERDTLAACNIPDQMNGRDWNMEKYLTPEMRAVTEFMDFAKVVSSAGRAQLIPWFWDRFCDGRMLQEARNAAAKKQADDLKKKWEERQKKEQEPDQVQKTDWQTEWERDKEE